MERDYLEWVNKAYRILVDNPEVPKMEIPPTIPSLGLKVFSATAFPSGALITTFAPSFAKSSAVARPTPLLPPVITAVLPCNVDIIILF